MIWQVWHVEYLNRTYSGKRDRKTADNERFPWCSVNNLAHTINEQTQVRENENNRWQMLLFIFSTNKLMIWLVDWTPQLNGYRTAARRVSSNISKRTSKSPDMLSQYSMSETNTIHIVGINTKCISYRATNIKGRICYYNINQASSASTPPAFVGNDYFCDTGRDGHIIPW